MKTITVDPSKDFEQQLNLANTVYKLSGSYDQGRKISHCTFR